MSFSNLQFANTFKNLTANGILTAVLESLNFTVFISHFKDLSIHLTVFIMKKIIT